jgi:hypothetical protein
MKESTTNLINRIFAGLVFMTLICVSFVIAYRFLLIPVGHLIKLPWDSPSIKIYLWIGGIVLFLAGFLVLIWIVNYFKIKNIYQIKIFGPESNFFSPLSIRIYIGLIIAGVLVSFMLGGTGALLLSAFRIE